MSKYGYEKHYAGAIGQFVVTITTPDGVLGGMLFTHTERAAAGIAEILNADMPGLALAEPPAKIPDTSVAGESMNDFDLLVTVRVYGDGSAMDAAGALCSGRGTFDLPGDGEVEILSARPADPEDAK